MMQALFAAISGLHNAQSWMDVLGNNIANTNTTAFKSSRVIFEDILSKTIKGASAPVTDGLGGTNPSQVGLGSSLSGVDTLHTQGNLSYTGNPSDLAIRGNGFFILSDGTSTTYTRDGTFGVDLNQTLVNLTSGWNVQGWLADPVTGVIDTSVDPTDLDMPAGLISYSVGSSGLITGLFADGPEPVGQIAMASFTNPAGLSKVGANRYQSTVNSGVADVGTANSEARGEISAGFLEMANVDLAAQFADMIMASRSFQANARIIRGWNEMMEELVNLVR